MEWYSIVIIVVLFIILIAASCSYDELRKENSNNEMLFDLTKKELNLTEKELQKVKFERDISLSKNNYYEQRESWRIERIKVLENSNDKIREHNSKLQEELDRLNKQKEDANSIPFNIKFFDPYEFKDTFGVKFMQDIINKELGIVPDGKISPKEDSKGCTNPYQNNCKVPVNCCCEDATRMPDYGLYKCECGSEDFTHLRSTENSGIKGEIPYNETEYQCVRCGRLHNIKTKMWGTNIQKDRVIKKES